MYHITMSWPKKGLDINDVEVFFFFFISEIF